MEPVYVNEKQYARILKRRAARAKLEMEGRIPKQRRVSKFILILYLYSFFCRNICMNQGIVMHKIEPEGRAENLIRVDIYSRGLDHPYRKKVEVNRQALMKRKWLKRRSQIFQRMNNDLSKEFSLIYLLLLTIILNFLNKIFSRL